MSDPSQIEEICRGVYSLQVISPRFQWVPQLIGAASAIAGGYCAVVARIRLEKKQEIEFIKISLIDELTEIRSIIDRMLETHNQTNIIPPSYFSELDENHQSFDQHKPRLFIIGDATLRKAICDFYKKLNQEVEKARTTVSSLNESDPAARTIITNSFTTIKTGATTLETQVRAYKFKLFGII